MKKIINILILLSLASNASFSQEILEAIDSDKNIDIVPQTSSDFSTAEVMSLPQSDMDSESLSLSPDVQKSSDNETIFTNDPQTNYELQGFLEYTEPAQAVYLEENVYRSSLKLKAPPKIGSKSLIPAKLKQSQYLEQRSLESASKFSNLEYLIAPISSSYSGKSGNFSIGTMYGSSLNDTAQLSYSTGVFTKYDGKHFALTAAFSKNTKSSFDSYSDKIYFAPELKITKRLSILDIVQADVMQATRKNEVVLRYTPPLKKYADDVQLELGAGQSFAEDKLINTSVRFSTKFKL